MIIMQYLYIPSVCVSQQMSEVSCGGPRINVHQCLRRISGEIKEGSTASEYFRLNDWFAVMNPTKRGSPRTRHCSNTNIIRDERGTINRKCKLWSPHTQTEALAAEQKLKMGRKTMAAAGLTGLRGENGRSQCEGFYCCNKNVLLPSQSPKWEVFPCSMSCSKGSLWWNGRKNSSRNIHQQTT